MNRLKRWAALSVLSVCSSIASAQGLSGAPITFVCPFPPGGGTDTLTRLVATSISEKTSWNIVVENKPGAGGNVALEGVARARPDGHTLVMAQLDNIVLNPWLYKKLPYDTFKDFTPVGLVAASALAFVVTADSPFHTLDDVVQAARKAPGTITLGIPGIGVSGDLIGHRWGKAANIELNHIPYRGWSQVYPDLMSKRIDMYTGSVASVLGQIQGGKIRALAVVGPERSAALPDVPTFAEAGFKEIDQATWWGVMAPSQTPPETIAELNRALNKTLADPEIVKQFLDNGFNVLSGTPQDMARRYKADYDLFGQIIKETGIKPQ